MEVHDGAHCADVARHRECLRESGGVRRRRRVKTGAQAQPGAREEEEWRESREEMRKGRRKGSVAETRGGTILVVRRGLSTRWPACEGGFGEARKRGGAGATQVRWAQKERPKPQLPLTYGDTRLSSLLFHSGACVVPPSLVCVLRGRRAVQAAEGNSVIRACWVGRVAALSIALDRLSLTGYGLRAGVTDHNRHGHERFNWVQVSISLVSRLRPHASF